MNLLLTHGYFLGEDPHEQQIMKPYPPLGILYISSYLKSKGIQVDVFDSTFKTTEDFQTLVQSERPSIVGIYCNLMTKLHVLDMIRFCKSQGAVVILGGPEPPYYSKEFLEFGADVIVIGEGEATVEHLLKEIPGVGIHNLHGIHGIAFRDSDGRVVHTPPRDLIKDLDSIPFPDREAIDVQQYITAWRDHHKLGSVSLITARGCPYTCKWCSHGVYGFTHRKRSPVNVVDEVEYLMRRYKPDMMWIADDVFTMNHKWFMEYFDEMMRRNLSIPFECITRADRVNEDILQKMAKLGCFRVWYGSESGSQKILDAMARGVTVEEIQAMTSLAQKHGIEVGLFVMLGYPGETIDDIQATIAHLKRTQADTFLTTVAYPIKGTGYQKEIEQDIDTDLPWDKRTERELRVRGRHTDAFYWFTERWMTNEVLSDRLSRNGQGRYLDGAAAFAKARVARLGATITSSWKS